MITAFLTRRLSGLVRRKLAGSIGDAKEASTRDDKRLRPRPDPGSNEEQVTVIGPARRWSEVAPEGTIAFDPSGPTVVAPATGTITGPSPRLLCQFPGGDIEIGR